MKQSQTERKQDTGNNPTQRITGPVNPMMSSYYAAVISWSVPAQVTFGQVQAQEPREAHRRHAGVEVRRRVAQELVRIWNEGSRWKREKVVVEQWRFEQSRSEGQPIRPLLICE